MRGHDRSSSGDAIEVPRGVKVWACPACRPAAGWISARDWAEDGYQRPVLAIHLPVSWNIDAWGPDVVSRVPAPWRLHIEFTSCPGPCGAASGPGQLWPTGSPEDTDTESGSSFSGADDDAEDKDC